MEIEYLFFNGTLLLGLVLLLPVLNPWNQLNRAVMLLPLLLIQIFYCHWRYSETLPSFEWHPANLWMTLFFVTELVVALYLSWQCIALLRFTDRSSQCNKLTVRSRTNKPASADLFIPTHSESAYILRTTIEAAKKDRYSDLTIWICDDGARDWLRTMCKELEVNYLRPSAHEKACSKAANLARSIPHGKADYVLCVDADFRITPSFTSRLTSLLIEPQIGLVQAPQRFRNADPVQKNLYGKQSWSEEQRFFFDISLPSRDAWGNALCVGSCWATRRGVIDKLGGFPTNSVVEDVYFGYQIKRLGYQTAHLNEELATGLAAEDVPSYIGQRCRWSMGAMALCSDPNGPFRAKNLSLIDRIFFMEIPMYWLTQLHLLLLLIAPSFFGFFGFNVFNSTTEEFMLIIVPKNLLLASVLYWISEGRCIPIITSVQRALPLFHVIKAIFSGLFKPRNCSFNVTRKDIQIVKRTIHWQLALPFIVIGVSNIIAIMVMHSQNLSQLEWTDTSAHNAMLTAYSLIVVFLCCLICVEKPEVNTNENSQVTTTGSLTMTVHSLIRRIFL